jgi:hypothetical protein
MAQQLATLQTHIQLLRQTKPIKMLFYQQQEKPIPA